MNTKPTTAHDKLQDELADELLAAHLNHELGSRLSQLGPRLSDPLMNALGRKLSVVLHQDPALSEKILEVSKAVSETLNSDYSRGFYLWHRATIGIYKNQYEGALDYFLQAEHLLKPLITYERSISLQANVIGILVYLGRYQEAFSRAEIAVSREDIPPSRQVARLYTNLALGHKNLGNLDDAAKWYVKAISILEMIEDHQQRALSRANLAVVRREQGRFVEARSILSECRRYYDANGFIRELARTNITLGLIEARCGNLRLGLHYLNLARLDFEAMDLHAEQATVAIYLAILHMNIGLLPDAQQTIDQAIKLLRPIGLKWHLALALLVKGIVLKSLSRLEKAADALTEATALFADIGSQKYATLADFERAENSWLADHGTPIAVDAELAEVPYVQSRLAILKPRLLLMNGRAKEAIEMLSESDLLNGASSDSKQQVAALKLLGESHEVLGQKHLARESFLAACRSIVFLCQHMYTDELRVAFLNGNSDLLAKLVELEFDLFHDGQSDMDSLFHSLNSVELFEPLSSLGEANHHWEKAQTTDIEINALREKWYWLELQNDALLTQNKGASGLNSYAEVNRERVSLEHELVERTRIRQSLLQQEAEETDTLFERPITTSRVQNRLAWRDIYLQYFTADNHIHAYVITACSAKVVTYLCPAQQLLRLIKTWRFLSYGQTGSADDKTYLPVLQQFFDLLLRPLAVEYERYDTLHVRMANALSDMPIQAFHDGLNFLIQYVNVAFKHNSQVRDHNWGKAKLEAHTLALIVGNDYEGTLPDVRIECRHVEDVLAPAATAIEFLAEVRDPAVFSEALACADLIHLACHGTFREDNALFSKLYLGPRPITALELSNVVFANSPLVVLNACRSGRGTALTSYANGFVHNFLRQGAAMVVATQWRINDRLARINIESFYQYWQHYSAPVKALNQSQRTAIQNGVGLLDWAAYRIWVA